MKLVTLDDDDYGGCGGGDYIYFSHIDPKGRKLRLATPLGKVNILSQTLFNVNILHNYRIQEARKR